MVVVSTSVVAEVCSVEEVVHQNLLAAGAGMRSRSCCYCCCNYSKEADRESNLRVGVLEVIIAVLRWGGSSLILALEEELGLDYCYYMIAVAGGKVLEVAVVMVQRWVCLYSRVSSAPEWIFRDGFRIQ